MESGYMKRAVMGAAVAAATLAAGLAQAVGVPGQGAWETTLLPRDIDGDTVTDAFYDAALDITWLRDADVNGLMEWDTAKTWADTLVVGGVGGWRLPKTVDTGAPGCDFSFAGGTDCGYNVDTASSEMAHLYYVTLGNLSPCPPGNPTCSGAGVPQPGSGLTNTGGFQNLDPTYYWSGTEYAPSPGLAWQFVTIYGYQHFQCSSGFGAFAMAVRPGDVAAVPEPQTYAMLLLGLGAVLLAARRRPA